MRTKRKFIRTKFPEKSALKALKVAPKDRMFAGVVLWDEKFTEVAEYYAQKGYTDREIATVFHVSPATITEWKKRKKEFREAIERGRLETNLNVEHAFYKLATGFSHPDVQVFVYKGSPIIVPTRKYYPPNAYAAYKWLTQRYQEKWNNISRSELNANINITNNVDLSDFSMDELKTIERLGLNKLAAQNATRNLN